MHGERVTQWKWSPGNSGRFTMRQAGTGRFQQTAEERGRRVGRCRAARPQPASALPACLHAQHHAVLRGGVVGRLAAITLEAEVERGPDLEAAADPVAL